MCLKIKKMTDQDKPNNGTIDTKFNIAKWVLLFGLSTVAVLGIVAIFFSKNCNDPDKTFSNVKDILSILLPLIGAWVGTVLAYYFSKENFQAAADSTKKLFQQFRNAEEKLQTLLAGNEMIKIDDFNKTSLILDKEEKEFKIIPDIIDKILEQNKSKPVNRLPVITDKLLPKYIIHRSTFDQFLVKMARAGTKLDDVTFDVMTSDPEFTTYLKNSYVTVSESATLADLKQLLDKMPLCQDAFVTKTGKADSEVVGWITNVTVAEKSKL
jgi:hypothetical protein